MSTPQFPRKKKSSRSLALQVLLESKEHKSFAQDVLDSHLKTSALSEPDRRLATQLVYGVLRRQGTLDAILKTAVTRDKDKVEPWLWETLRLGVYQLALLSNIPPHAALNETVQLAQVVGIPRGKGFLNGVLRKVSRLIADDFCDAPGPAALPVESGRYRCLQEQVLPDPRSSPIDYLAAGLSLPRWLAERWYERFGWEECLRLGFWFAGPAPIYLRVNSLKATREEVLDELAKADIQAEPGTHPQSIKLLASVPIPTLPGFLEGRITVQDESAMWAGTTLGAKSHSKVLDLCAAPGGKTTHIAERMENQGAILACDIDPKRLNTLMDLCRRLGITIVEPKLINPKQKENFPGQQFDSILVDVPCSNTGVLGRRPEVRWRLDQKEFHFLARLQKNLLVQAGNHIRPGGTIVYSTCSIEPEENRTIVEAVVQGFPSLELVEEVSHLPGKPADGGYLAKLVQKK